MKRTILAFVALAGCATVSDVVPTGDGTYMVSSHGISGNGSAPEQKAYAVRKAADFCAGQSKVLEIMKEETMSPAFGRPPSAEIDFRCLPKP